MCSSDLYQSTRRHVRKIFGAERMFFNNNISYFLIDLIYNDRRGSSANLYLFRSTTQNRTEQNRTEQNRTEQNRAEQNRVDLNARVMLAL